MKTSTWSLHSQNKNFCKVGQGCWYCKNEVKVEPPKFIKCFEAGYGNRKSLRGLTNRAERMQRINRRVGKFNEIFRLENALKNANRNPAYR